MTEKKPDNLEYTILNPTGNITALVDSDVEISRQPLVAAELMQKHPEVEQVGFVTCSPFPTLRMAGGEFCGNAAMCAAVLCAIKQGAATDPTELYISVSGAAQPVKVGLARQGKDRWETSIRMPGSAGVVRKEFSLGDKRGVLPVVHMGGITHIIVEPESAFAYLSEDPQAAESAVKKWCVELSAEGLGLMFLLEEKAHPAGMYLSEESTHSARDMISTGETPCPGAETAAKVYGLRPLVYIPGSGTMFWENSCASGSAATAIYLAGEEGVFTDVTLIEPGGTLRVTSDPAGGETWLYGQVIVTL